jgi:hypothetical protein
VEGRRLGGRGWLYAGRRGKLISSPRDAARGPRGGELGFDRTVPTKQA